MRRNKEKAANYVEMGPQIGYTHLPDPTPAWLAGQEQLKGTGGEFFRGDTRSIIRPMARWAIKMYEKLTGRSRSGAEDEMEPNATKWEGHVDKLVEKYGHWMTGAYLVRKGLKATHALRTAPVNPLPVNYTATETESLQNDNPDVVIERSAGTVFASIEREALLDLLPGYENFLVEGYDYYGAFAAPRRSQYRLDKQDRKTIRKPPRLQQPQGYPSVELLVAQMPWRANKDHDVRIDDVDLKVPLDSYELRGGSSQRQEAFVQATNSVYEKANRLKRLR